MCFTEGGENELMFFDLLINVVHDIALILSNKNGASPGALADLGNAPRSSYPLKEEILKRFGNPSGLRSI